MPAPNPSTSARMPRAARRSRGRGFDERMSEVEERAIGRERPQLGHDRSDPAINRNAGASSHNRTCAQLAMYEIALSGGKLRRAGTDTNLRQRFGSCLGLALLPESTNGGVRNVEIRPE